MVEISVHDKMPEVYVLTRSGYFHDDAKAFAAEQEPDRKWNWDELSQAHHAYPHLWKGPVYSYFMRS